MSTASTQPSASARRLTQELLRRVAKVKNQTIAEAIGKDESTISRIVSNESGLRLNDLYAFLAVLGLKIVDADQICVDHKIHESYKTLATAYLTNSGKSSEGSE